MTKKYPKIGAIIPRPKNIHALCVCGEIGKFRVMLEINQFRGDDDCVWACEQHKKDLNFLIKY